MKKNNIIGIISPIVIIAICYIFIIIAAKYFFELVFIFAAPTIIYWLLSLILIIKMVGKNTIKSYFNKPEGKIGWLILSIIIGFNPFSFLLLKINLLNNIFLWILFSLINPFFEEIFWRGFLLENTFNSKIISTIYSTVLYVLSHQFIWGIFLLGNRYFTLISLIIMGSIWSIIRYKTKSLWWNIISHIMVNFFYLSVFVFIIPTLY